MGKTGTFDELAVSLLRRGGGGSEEGAVAWDRALRGEKGLVGCLRPRPGQV